MQGIPSLLEMSLPVLCVWFVTPSNIMMNKHTEYENLLKVNRKYFFLH